MSMKTNRENKLLVLHQYLNDVAQQRLHVNSQY